MKYYELEGRVIISYPLEYLYQKHSDISRTLKQILSELQFAPSYELTKLERFNFDNNRFNGKGNTTINAVLVNPLELDICLDNIFITLSGVEEPFTNLGKTPYFYRTIMNEAAAYNLANGTHYGIFNVINQTILMPTSYLDTNVPSTLPDSLDEDNNSILIRDWGGSWIEGDSGRILYKVYTPNYQGALKMEDYVKLYDIVEGNVNMEMVSNYDYNQYLQTSEFSS